MSINISNKIICSKFPYPEAILFFSGAFYGINFFIRLINSGFPEANRLMFIIALIIIFYEILFIKSCFIIKHFYWGNFVFSCLFAFVMVYSFMDYDRLMMNNDQGFIDYLNGKTNIDYLFQAAQTESITNFGYPSLLHIYPKFIKYHSAIFFIFAGLSVLTNIPVLMLFHYVYPLLAGPLFFFLLLKLTIEIRKYLSLENELDISDILIISIFLTGNMGIMIYGYYFGLFVPTIILSNSMLLGMDCLIAVALFVFVSIRKGFLQKKYFRIILALIIIPITLLLCTLAKVTAGCFYLGILFVILFTNKNHYKFRYVESILMLFYVLLFFVFCINFVNGSGGKYFNFINIDKGCVNYTITNSRSALRLVPFAFLRSYSLFRNILLIIMTWGPVALYLYFSGWFGNNVKITYNKMLGNMLLLSSIGMWIPPLLIDIHGHSGVFFFLIPYVFSILLCCAIRIPKILFLYIPTQYRKLFLIIMVIPLLFISGMSICKFINSFYLLFVNRINTSFSQYEITNNKLYESLRITREFAKKNSKDTICYINQTSPFLHNNGKATSLLLQAYIGLPVLNGFWYENGELFVYGIKNGKSYITKSVTRSGVHAYGLDGWKKFHDGPIDQEEALTIARKMGYKNIILFCNNTISIQKL